APARRAGDGEGAKFPGADARADRPRGCRDEIDIALKEARDRRRLAAIWNVQKPCFGLASHQFHGRVEDRAYAGRAVLQSAGIFARSLDQLLERLEAGVFAHADEERVEACDRNPFEVFDDLVIYGPGQRAMRRMGAGNDQERVAVRVAARDHLCGEAAGRSWLWLNHDRLPKT